MVTAVRNNLTLLNRTPPHVCVDLLIVCSGRKIGDGIHKIVGTRTGRSDRHSLTRHQWLCGSLC